MSRRQVGLSLRGYLSIGHRLVTILAAKADLRPLARRRDFSRQPLWIGEEDHTMTNPERILAIDVGAGTQDILLWESDRTPENCTQLILPSQTQIVGGADPATDGGAGDRST